MDSPRATTSDLELRVIRPDTQSSCTLRWHFEDYASYAAQCLGVFPTEIGAWFYIVSGLLLLAFEGYVLVRLFLSSNREKLTESVEVGNPRINIDSQRYCANSGPTDFLGARNTKDKIDYYRTKSPPELFIHALDSQGIIEVLQVA
ncbi:hypothetical protein C8R47DRAFT_1062872 [Mycena vitilis]|nr:hypothetical protein C8R47DRAFT_1062872 [Mycena vitilis]